MCMPSMSSQYLRWHSLIPDTAARAQLGEKPFAAAWAEGRLMTPEQALAAREAVMNDSEHGD